jgi:hypothetical protein
MAHWEKCELRKQKLRAQYETGSIPSIKTAQIWLENGRCVIIKYTSFTSEDVEKAYFFMDGLDNVAIVPWRYLVTFND